MLAIALSSCLARPTALSQPVAPSLSPPPAPSIIYQTQVRDRYTMHVLRIPNHARFEVQPALTQGVATVEEFAQQTGATAVINGGYFDPANQQTTSFIVRDGQLVADPRTNSRLMENPQLTRYLPQILDRSEFRRMQCGDDVTVAIARHSIPMPQSCHLLDALGAGPQLLPEFTAEAEGFIDKADARVVRDALGSDRPNARSALGITATGEILLVMVAQWPDSPADSGISLPGLAALLQELGATTALNLDGGSSSSLYYGGRAMYGKVNAHGAIVQRPVKSVLIVKQRF